jgi:hypothetical protein
MRMYSITGKKISYDSFAHILTRLFDEKTIHSLTLLWEFKRARIPFVTHWFYINWVHGAKKSTYT